MVEHKVLLLDCSTVLSQLSCVSSRRMTPYIHPEHFKYDSSDGARVNFIVGDNKDLYTYIIQHFSQPNSTVLDLTTSHTEGK